jgi:carboxyl-terminal processing protease
MRKKEYGQSARRLVLSAALLGLSACGGGGGGDGGGSSSGGGSGGIQYTAGVFMPSSSFAAQCAAPRTGIDPATGRLYPDVPGSVTAENHWLRSWTNELYLWYREVPDVDPASFPTTEAYFELQKTTATTASGKPKDRFHSTFPTAEFRQLAQSGVQAGYGLEWVIVSGVRPRRVVVAYTQPNSPATSANLTRGAEVLAVDNIDLVNTSSQAGVDTLNAGLFPATVGESHTFRVRDLSGTERSITMQSANVTSAPVQNVRELSTSTGTVGYMLFNDHIATAESALIDAVNTLRSANVTDLVLDIRYNGGGFLDIASELAYMIAGSGPTAGRAFETLRFNDKHTTTDPVTGEPLTPTPFHTTRQFSTPAGQPLPTLNLQRVFVLTGPSTCSASESIINGLRGVNVEVIQIGSTTCGKPYGFHPADNCGTTYFSIQFQGDNAQGFGDYTDGFSPNNATGAAGFRIPGCSVADDFSRALGDPQERRLAAALRYRANSMDCPTASGFAPGMLSNLGGFVSLDQADGVMRRGPWRENRILRSMQ